MAKITKNYTFGRGQNTLKGEMKTSIKANKKRLNRKARHAKIVGDGCFYKRLAGMAAYDLTT